MRNGEWEMWNRERGMGKEWGIQNEEWGMENEEWGMVNEE